MMKARTIPELYVLRYIDRFFSLKTMEIIDVQGLPQCKMVRDPDHNMLLVWWNARGHRIQTHLLQEGDSVHITVRIARRAHDARPLRPRHS